MNEKKYYLQKIEKFYEYEYDEYCAYLNFDIEEGDFELNNAAQNRYFKTQFTQREIDKIKEKYSTNLEEFKKIEVEK